MRSPRGGVKEPSRLLVLIAILTLVLVIPLSQQGWGDELPWLKLIAALVGPGVVYYLFWHYRRDAARARPRIERQLILIGIPAAAVLGASLAGAEGAGPLATAALLGFVGGLLIDFFRT
jgi:predicted cation transporter